MPLKIIRQDITKIECDAIVNATNEKLIPAGEGVDSAIHSAAGEGLLDACRAVGGVNVGGAVVTEAFDLPCKYVIHTAGPVWSGGDNGERELLESCYTSSLALALEKGCESVAIPLISSGAYGYPKDQVLKVAMSAINDFLFDNEMTVYLVVYDKASYEFSRGLFSNIISYMDNWGGYGLYEESGDFVRGAIDEKHRKDEIQRQRRPLAGSGGGSFGSCKGSICRRRQFREYADNGADR